MLGTMMEQRVFILFVIRIPETDFIKLSMFWKYLTGSNSHGISSVQNVPTLQCQIQALNALTVWLSSIESEVRERKEQYLESSSKDVVDFDIENAQSSLSERDENISSPIEENNERKHHRLLDNTDLYLPIIKIPKIDNFIRGGRSFSRGNVKGSDGGEEYIIFLPFS